MILGLIGPKGVGKSTLARYLNVELDFRRVSFADPLRDMVSALLYAQECPEEEVERLLNGDLKELPSLVYLAGKSPRYVLQTLGTEWGRNLIDPNLWVHVWKQTITNLQEHIHAKDFVTDDTRFLSEAKAIRDMGGKLIRINREGYGPNEQHQSESEYLEIKPDLVIHNVSEPTYMLEQLKAAGFPNL